MPKTFPPPLRVSDPGMHHLPHCTMRYMFPTHLTQGQQTISIFMIKGPPVSPPNIQFHPPLETQYDKISCLWNFMTYFGVTHTMCRDPLIYCVPRWATVQEKSFGSRDPCSIPTSSTAEEDSLSPFESKTACLCQSIEINNNKHVYRQSPVRIPTGSGVELADC